MRPAGIAKIVAVSLVGLGVLIVLEPFTRVVFGMSTQQVVVIAIDLTLYCAILLAVVRMIRFHDRVAVFWRNRWRHCLLAAGSILIGLVTAEQVLRIIRPDFALPSYWTNSSKQFHHVYPASTTMHGGRVEGRLTVVTTNKDGLRTQYEREDFLSYRDRIVILGDSFTFGHGVQQDEAFPKVMERYLRKRLGRNDLAVLNAGIISYSPLLEGILYRNLLGPYKPTLTILVLDATDIADDYSYAQQMVRDPVTGDVSFDVEERTIQASFWDHVALSRVAQSVKGPLLLPVTTARELLFEPQQQARKRPDYYNFAIRVGDEIETSRFFIFKHPLEETERYFRDTLGHVQGVAKNAAKSGSDFFVVITPRFQHWSARECPDNWEKTEYELDEPYEYEFLRFFENVEDSLDFDLVHLLPVFEQAEEFPLIFQADPHWNPTGHELVGKSLARIVADRLRERAD